MRWPGMYLLYIPEILSTALWRAVPLSLDAWSCGSSYCLHHFLLVELVEAKAATVSLLEVPHPLLAESKPCLRGMFDDGAEGIL